MINKDKQSENVLDLLASLYKQWNGDDFDSIIPLPESGSYRKYFRILHKGNTVLGVYNDDLRENNAFFYFAKHLRESGNNIPEILAIDKSRKAYLEEDVGNLTLLDYLKQKDYVKIKNESMIYKK